MTTIITKYGYGVPADGKLAKGEIAVDLTDGILYSSPNGTDIIELGRGEISWDNICQANRPSLLLAVTGISIWRIYWVESRRSRVISQT